MEDRNSFRKLLVWQRSMELAENIYKITKGFPQEEKYGLTNQIRRAVVSVPSNIAEGQGRKSKKEFQHFLFIAKASNQEVETQLELSYRLKYVDEENYKTILKECDIISRMLQNLTSKLN